MNVSNEVFIDTNNTQITNIALKQQQLYYTVARLSVRFGVQCISEFAHVFIFIFPYIRSHSCTVLTAW